MRAGGNLVVPAVVLLLAGVAISYERPPPRKTLRQQQFHQADSAQQVHISLVGPDRMRISYITAGESPAMVNYHTSPGYYPSSARIEGVSSSYSYLIYKSGLIHNVVIGPLQENTTYFYKCGDQSPEFSFRTPPARFPVKFAVVGDLGQTEWTSSTLQHVARSDYDVLLLPGDLSYADMYQPFWDSFGRLVEPLARRRPWMVTQGNHDIERVPFLHADAFTSFNARWRMPYEESGSGSNLYYSFEVAGVHVAMLGSYVDFDKGSAQYRWLEGDLAKVSRSKTPWLVVVLHAPWYNTNSAHRDEPESVGMRAAMEDLLYRARVDMVFSGHVHAYERFTRVFQGKEDECGPVYITIGDGGNREGLATEYEEPHPQISLFREASFGHGQLSVTNYTHALWEWHRNDNDEAVVADSVWLTTLASESSCAN